MNRRARAATGVRTSAGFQTLAGWLLRLARLDFSVFDDLRSERTATASAILIVLAASLTAGMGSWFWALQNDDLGGLDPAEVFVKTVLAGGLLQTGVFFLWVAMTYVVLTRMFAVQVLYADLVRTMGLAFAPVALGLFVALTPLAVPFGVFALSVTLLTTTNAVEQTSGVGQREAIFANLAGFAAFLVFMGALANVAEAGRFGGLAPGLLFFALDF
jgi:hypothetical protein